MKYSCKTVSILVLRLLLSHFGSFILVMLYVLGGGYLFMYLEAQNEIEACSTSMTIFYNKLNETTTRAVTISKAGYNDTVLYQQVIGMLTDFSKDVYSLSVSPAMNCSTIGTPDNQPSWNLANTIFFCATLVTTIGYGHIYPVTQWGRIVCIIYSFIGIPLMLIFLSNFGVVLANAFRYVYFNLCCCRCFLKRQKEPEVEIIECSKASLTDMKNIGPQKMMTESDQEVEQEDTSPITIPIIVITAFLAFYMFLGAAIFRTWEDWDYVAGIYFSFITVSTIGLGDLYPTKDRTMTVDATVELLAAAAYCLIGLAILSMCLSLIQEEISCKLQWLGDKLGLNSNEEENLEDSDERDYNDNGSKPMIVQEPLIISQRHNNEAYDEDVYGETTDDPHVGIYPKFD